MGFRWKGYCKKLQLAQTPELSTRAYRCLKDINIITIRELAQKTDGELLDIVGFGGNSLADVHKELKKFGLHTGMKFDPSQP